MKTSRVLLWGVIAVAAVAGGYWAWLRYAEAGLPAGIAAGNGRIEAAEIDISTKSPGRIKDILVGEGDFVTAGQTMARMDITQLTAQRRQAEAQLKRAQIGIDTAGSLVEQRQAEQAAAEAVIDQRSAELEAAEKRLSRSAQLVQTNSVSQQTYDDNQASERSARAALAAARAQLAAAKAAIGAARATVVDAEAAADAARAAIESIAAEIDDGTLVAPRDGRIQYRVAQPGEVLSAGGRVLNLVDLGDVYMTIFLPTAEAGRIAIGTEVRLVLDAAPQYVIPAKVSFVADVAQFTPKTVETEEERQKLMFRVKAQIPPELLRKHIQLVKTGLPGMAYVRLDPAVEWPRELTDGLVQ